MSGPLILGIESSCDETGVGIVRGHELLANEVASSVALHARFGGVVPEVASRAHLEAMVPTLQRACATADVDLSELDGIAVTAGPGLMGALVVGLAAAKALAYALDKPLYGVNHLAGHVAVDLLEHGPLPERCVALLVSGGHTSLLQVDGITGRDHRAGLDHRRRGRRGVRQGGPAARAALPGGPADRPRGHRRPAARELPARPDRAQGPRPAPVRLLLLRAEDGGGPVGRDRAAPRSPGAGARRGRQLPGGGLRRAERQGAGRVRRDRGRLVC